MTTIGTMLRTVGVSPIELGDHLDSLSRSERIAQCLSLSPIQQKRLWEVASAAPRPDGNLFGSGPDDRTTIFAGRNSLRIFAHFEKRFARQDQALIGYNKHALGWLIGPGYFTVLPAAGGPGLIFDYGQRPSHAPGGWPPVVSNTGLFSRPVYGGLSDEVVWVSADVLVGSAFRAGVSMGSFFVLARAS